MSHRRQLQASDQYNEPVGHQGRSREGIFHADIDAMEGELYVLITCHVPRESFVYWWSVLPLRHQGPRLQKSISTWAPSFAGSDQQDSQEFLSFLLDGLHEDLNRIRTKPPPVEMTPDREAALETLPPVVAADKEWQIYKMRNDSLIVDLFQGQYRNRMECLTCHKVSGVAMLNMMWPLLTSSLCF